MLHHRPINFHYHVRCKGLNPWDVLRAAITSLLVLLNRTLCRCSMFTSLCVSEWRVSKKKKKNATQKSRNDHMTRVRRGNGCTCSDGNQVCSIKSGGQRLQSEVKVITFLYFQSSHPLRCITKRVGTTSTQWKQTASSTDVITRISPVSPSLPPLPLPSDPLIRPMGGERKRQRGGRVRQAPSFPAVLQQAQIRSHGRGAADSPVCVLALKEKSQDDQANVSACKETSRGRSDRTFCPPFWLFFMTDNMLQPEHTDDV